MDDFKKGPGYDPDFDDIEIIDATESDVIEVVDPYESEVIEVNNQRGNGGKKGPTGHVTPAPDKKIMDADFDAFNPSRTVILNKGSKDKDNAGNSSYNDDFDDFDDIIAVPSSDEAPRKFVATPPNGKIKDVPPAPAAQPVQKANSGFKAVPPTGKIVVPESIDVGGSTTTILKKGAPKEDDKKATNNASSQSVSKPSSEPSNQSPKPQVPPKSKASVNTSLAGAKQKSNTSANPLFSGPETEEESKKPKSFIDQVKSGYVTVAGREIPVKPVAIAIGALIALIIIINIFAGNSRVKISMNAYVTISYDGFNGTATPVAEINYEKLAADFGDKVEIKSSKTLEDLIKENVKYSFDKSDNLSNGDSINLVWDLNEDAFENATNASFTGSKKKAVAVTGIPEMIKDYDLFKNLECKYEGYSGEGTVSVTASDEHFPELVYSADKTSDICNDDEITISVSVEGVDDVAAYLKKKGYEVTATSTKVVASNLKEFELCDIFAGVKLTFSGFNGIGTAVVSGDTGFANLSYKIEKVSDLTNGDKIVVKVVSNNEQTVQQTVHANHLSISSESKEFVVSGLTETLAYDPFDEITFKYTGISPDGILSAIDDSLVTVKGLSFSSDKKAPVANGDSLTITVSCADGSDPVKYCLSLGYELKSTSKTIKVEGLAHYLDSVTEVDEESKELFDQQCQSIMEEIIVSEIGKSIVKSVKLSSIYVQYPQSTDVILAYNKGWEIDIHNRLYFVYEVEIEDGSTEFTYYWPIVFVNITVNSDGMLVGDMSKYIAKPNTFSLNRIEFSGYMQMSEFTASLENDTVVYAYDHN